MLKNSETEEQICTIQSQVTTLQMAFFITEHLFLKKTTNFSSMHVGICVKDATPLRPNNKLNPHMELMQGFAPGPHWWEASALTTGYQMPISN